MRSLEWKLVVLEDGKPVAEEVLSHDLVREVISSLPDSEDHSSLLELAAHHPSHVVRGVVAHKDKLSETTLEKLSRDDTVQVLSDLCRSDAFKAWADTELLMSLIHRDPVLAYSIAPNLESYENSNILKVAEALAAHPDPVVLESLADNYRTPKSILKKLAKHPSPGVAAAAQRTLGG